jgi:YgiT-type zinc finger domain-containing protein
MRDYHINVFYSEEDEGYVGDIPDLHHCSAFGTTPEKALREVLTDKQAWLEKEKEMKCIICQGEEIELKEVKEELKLEGDIVCVPIQILVCRTCGERYYDRRTIHFLEEVEQKLREGKANLQEVGKVLIYG